MLLGRACAAWSASAPAQPAAPELVALDSGGTRVRYAVIEPAFYVPAMIGTKRVRKDIAGMMTAALQRMERDK